MEEDSQSLSMMEFAIISAFYGFCGKGKAGVGTDFKGVVILFEANLHAYEYMYLYFHVTIILSYFRGEY